MPNFPAIGDIGRHVHDAFFRAMLSDPVRADAMIRAHWPRQLHRMLEGDPVRPLDSALVRRNLKRLRTDSLFLVGGHDNRPNALCVPEAKFRPDSRTPDQMGLYRCTVQDGLEELLAEAAFIPMVFHTGGGLWGVSGVIDETSEDPWRILVQLQKLRSYFIRQTRAIDYGRLSCEPVSRAMLGMMGLAGRRPYPSE